MIHCNRCNKDLNEHKEMYIKQNGKCLICDNSIDYDKIVVDHNHKTGEIRGLLCIFCNTLAGYVEKHPNRIKKVENYLRKY